MAKPYQSVPIQDCGEPLLPIPEDQFCLVAPHCYQALGADYAGRSPYSLRAGVLERLLQAQAYLQKQQPGLQFRIFDAYRPIPVQQFMVDYTFAQLKGDRLLSPAETESLWETVLGFWAIPSDHPATPPPHSTGAAVDITLAAPDGEPLTMGGEIDEIAEFSVPDFYAAATTEPEQRYHRHRQWLRGAMEYAGFCIHPNEWWHFSYGDQLWAWQTKRAIARYGRI